MMSQVANFGLAVAEATDQIARRENGHHVAVPLVHQLDGGHDDEHLTSSSQFIGCCATPSIVLPDPVTASTTPQCCAASQQTRASRCTRTNANDRTRCCRPLVT